MYSSQKSATQYSTKRQIQLFLAQQSHNELTSSLSEKFQSIRLQLKHMQHIVSHQYQPVQTDRQKSLTIQEQQPKQNPKQNQSNNQNEKYFHLIKQAKEQYQTFESFSKQLSILTTQNLLTKQSLLQQEAQRYSFIKQYEQRIYEMDCNLYTKEVDISVDHVGKLEREKPTGQRLREFQRGSVQFQNICGFMNKLELQRKKVQFLKKKVHKNKIPQTKQAQPDINQQKSSQLTASKTLQQSQRPRTETNIKSLPASPSQKNIQTARTKQSSGSIDSNPQKQQFDKSTNKNNSKHHNQHQHQHRKKLLLSSQKQMFEETSRINADPQMYRIASLLESQKKRELKLRAEYEKLRGLFGRLCVENVQLGRSYRELVRGSRQEQIGVFEAIEI